MTTKNKLPQLKTLRQFFRACLVSNHVQILPKKHAQGDTKQALITQRKGALNSPLIILLLSDKSVFAVHKHGLSAVYYAVLGYNHL